MPGRDPISTRLVETSDSEILIAIAASARASEVAAFPWSNGEKQVFLRSQAELKLRGYQSSFPDSEQSVILRQGVPIGSIWISYGPEEIRLVDIALLPEHRGSGTGTMLISRLVLEAKRLGVPLRLSVRRQNLAAIRLYDRLGAVVVSQSELDFQMEWPRQAVS